MSTSLPIENWGQLKFQSLKSEVKNEDGGESTEEMCLELLSLPKGKEKGSANFVSRPIVRVPVSTIASASGTTKNDLSLTLRPNASAAGGVELTSLRFAVPDMCVGYEQTEEAGREILSTLQDSMRDYQRQFLKSQKAGSADDNLLMLATMGTGTAKHEDETIIGTFDDVNLSYPAGRYKMVLSKYNVVLEDKRKGAAGGGLLTFPMADIQQLYLCDVPAYFGSSGGDGTETIAQYVVLILRNPVKIRTTSYANVVISCPNDLVLDEEHAWRCELKTQDAINSVLGFPKQEEGTEYPLVPAMSGRVSDILVRTFKSIAKVPAYGGRNKEYLSVLTQGSQSCMRCLFHGTEGLLYIVSGGLLYLHRPATRIAFRDVSRITLDESESGTATFQFTVYADGVKGEEKYVFSSLDKAEKDGLIKYLGSKVKLQVFGLDVDVHDDEEDEEDEEDDEDASEDGEDEEDDDFDSDEGSDDGGRTKKRSKKESRKRDRSGEKESKKERRDRKRHKKEKKRHRKHSRSDKDGNDGTA